MPDLDSADLYKRLGVSRSASTEEIKRAYRALVRQYTPERAPEAFKRIREAYETLSKPETRRQYDSRTEPPIARLFYDGGARPDLDSADLYRRLGVSRSASTEEIKFAYRALVRQYTPERAPEAFKRIREAYKTLSNPETRRQYDFRPEPQIARLLSEAAAAMKSQQFQIAEQAYKKVLLAAPGLSWVRNLLGLCFLYQRRADEAISQYERLLREARVDASVHANAGQAYWMARRFDDAEREFRAAKSADDEQSFEYGLSLIQVIVDRGEPERADKLATAEADAAPRGSVAALEYAAKRIDLALVLGRPYTIPTLLSRIQESVWTDEQRRYGAFVLGKMSGRLIAGEAFLTAEQVARSAQALQPSDPNYDALEVVSRLLHENNFDDVARLFSTHASFARGAWLEGLKPVIEQYCTTHAAIKGTVPVTSAPSRFRIIGIGTTIYGQRDDDPRTGSFVVTQYFTFLFVPLFPLAAYRVRTAQDGGWLFLWKVPLSQSEKYHRERGIIWPTVIGLLIGVILWADLTQPRPRAALGVATQGSSTGDGPGCPPIQASGVSAPPPPGALAVYEGDAGYDTYFRSNMRLTIYDWRGKGYLTVAGELAPGGRLYLRARSDSIRFVTLSNIGDTILWYGSRVGDGAAGRYRKYHWRQYGTWRICRSSGTPIPPSLNPW